MAKPWLQNYDPGVPTSIGEYPDRTLVDFVAHWAKKRPNGTAVAFKGRKLSWREIERESDALANALHADGIRPRDRVALLLPNCPQFIIAELAIWKLGAIIAPLNPLYTEHELLQAIEAAAPRAIIVLTPFYQTIKHLQARTDVERVIATNIKEYLPKVLGVLFTLVKEKKEGHRVELQKGDVWFQTMVEGGRKGKRPRHAVQPGDAAILLMSGGTTGTPKGVLSEHRSMVMSAAQLSAWLKDALAGEGASIMLPLPLFHTYGCAGAQTITISLGIPLILVPNPRDFGDVIATVKRDRPTLFCGVPSLFNALLNHPAVMAGKSDFKSIRACFSGAAPLMAETKKRFEDLTGGRIVEGYSLTEATMACCVNPLKGTNKIGSIGLPMPDVEVRILDAEDGRTEMETGKVGEIVMKAPQLMRGYWNNSAETDQILRDGWLYTGDLAYMDEDGYIFIVDRKKDLIKAGGFQVWPREIEEVIAAHPAVAEVGVAGVVDPHRGETIHAWIVARPGMSVDFDELREFCRTELAPYKVPRHFELRAELPKTMVGKILRRKLVAEAMGRSE